MDNEMLRPAALPMRPWDYIRRRRLLAGLTIAEAAKPYWHRPEHRADVEANMRSFESPGVLMKPWVANDRRSFDFDPAVYRQLQDIPQFHPTLCRCCGSTDYEARETRDGGRATLDAEQICSACREDQAERSSQQSFDLTQRMLGEREAA